MKIDALVLAGGKSSRMGGKHKGNLLYHQTRLTERMSIELQKITDTVYISYGSCLQDDTSAGIPVMDIYPGCGPMGGLHAGLLASHADLVLAAPCDMPLLNCSFYEFLLDTLRQKERQENHTGFPVSFFHAVVPVHEGKIEPLAAVYRPEAASFFEAQLHTGSYRLRLALDQMNVLYPDLSERPDLTKMLVNINTPEDYSALSGRE